MKMKKGFTLIELLVVIGIIGILAAIVLIAVNPGRQFAQARNTQRRGDVLTITNAIYQFASENNGNLPDTDSDDTTSNFPTSATCIGSDVLCFDLANAGKSDGGSPATTIDTIVSTFIAGLPEDPSAGSGDGTNADYLLHVDAGTGRIVCSAPSAELEEVISITR